MIFGFLLLNGTENTYFFPSNLIFASSDSICCVVNCYTRFKKKEQYEVPEVL